MIFHLVVTAILWINDFPPSKPGAGLSNTKGPVIVFLGTVVYHKKVCHIELGKYYQVHQEDESWNANNIYQTVVAIFLVPQYNLQG